MKTNEPKYCIVCETEVEIGSRSKPNKAEYFEKFNGDLIPVCRMHKKVLRSEHLDDILDEQPDE